MDSQASDFLSDVSPKEGRRSFKLFFGILVGFALALYLMPTETVIEVPRSAKRMVPNKPRTHIPIWTWKTLLNSVEEQLSPLIGNVRFQGEGRKSARIDTGEMNPAQNGSIHSAQGGGSNGAKDALSRIAKNQTDQFTKNAFHKMKGHAGTSSFMDAARVPGAVALMGAALASGRQMKMKVSSDTTVRAQIARDDTVRRDYRVNVERQIPGIGTSLSSGMSSNGGLDQVAVKQSLGDGWNLGVNRSRVDRSIAGSTSDRAENAVTLGFSSDF